MRPHRPLDLVGRWFVDGAFRWIHDRVEQVTVLQAHERTILPIDRAQTSNNKLPSDSTHCSQEESSNEPVHSAQLPVRAHSKSRREALHMVRPRAHSESRLDAFPVSF